MHNLSKTKTFKEILNSSTLEFAMEAHNGLSAKIVENSGFKVIWASGFSISSSLGLRDANEISMTQLTTIVENMVDVTSIPVFVDGDTGYGNFNNVRLLVRKLSQFGASGVCIEDKVFPKMNSLTSGLKQELVTIEEFCGKIKAAKDSSVDSNFSIIARVEALIVGESMSEAIKRAEAYRLAGADGILVHSKKPDASEIIEFTTHWDNRCPLVIVPTNYYKTPTKLFDGARISLVLWANANFRASINSMEKVSTKMFKEQTLTSVENEICSIDHIFKILDYDELKEAEKKYFDQPLGDKK